MIGKKESENEYGLPFYFHSFCKDWFSIYPENRMKKGLLLFFQETD
jgi:hypothetical protein